VIRMPVIACSYAGVSTILGHRGRLDRSARPGSPSLANCPAMLYGPLFCTVIAIVLSS